MAEKSNIEHERGAGADSLLHRKLSRLALRSRLDSALARGALWGAGFALAGACAVLAGRLTGAIPEGTFGFETLLFPVALGVVFGTLFHKRVDTAEAAKIADDALGAKDLFQTALAIKDPERGYAKLPLADAEREAKRIVPADALPFSFQRELWALGAGLAVMALCLAFVPRLDPFGRDAARKRAEENKKRSEKIAKQVKRRLDSLKKADMKNSPEVERLLAEVKQRFAALRKSRRAENEKSLRQAKAAIDNLWKRKAEQRLRDKSLSSMSKRFGALDAKRREWLNQIKKRDYSGVMKEARELRRLAAEIAKTTNPEERKRKEEELKKRLQKLSDFVASKCGSKNCQNALKNALEQLSMSGMNGVDRNAAMKSLADAMNLSERELQKLQQMANDLSDLEMASKACQMARELNNLKKAMAANQSGMQSMDDYAKFYEECVRQCQGNGEKGTGKGKGQGDPGGGGGKAEENDKAKTAMTDEKSKSRLQPGKILMRWNVKGMGKTGTVDENYKSSVEKVKQDANEAILKEEVPPGYHETIKKYFKDMK